MEPGVFIQDRFLPLRDSLQGAEGLRPCVTLLELGGAVAQSVGARIGLLAIPLPPLPAATCLAPLMGHIRREAVGLAGMCARMRRAWMRADSPPVY